ncbi:hypothetical protein ACFLTE_08520 [Bacteroidota bacterium]
MGAFGNIIFTYFHLAFNKYAEDEKMTLSEVVQASTIFVMINIFIVVIGILTAELFKRKSRKDVVLVMIVLMGLLARIFIDTYWDFAGHQDLILGKEGLSLSFLLFVGIFFAFHELWGKIDKKFAFSIIVSSIVLIFSSFSLLSITPLVNIIPSKVSLFLLSSSVGLTQAILVMAISFATYFLVIKFLVDTSGGVR